MLPKSATLGKLPDELAVCWTGLNVADLFGLGNSELDLQEGKDDVHLRLCQHLQQIKG